MKFRNRIVYMFLSIVMIIDNNKKRQEGRSSKGFQRFWDLGLNDSKTENVTLNKIDDLM